MKYLSKITVLSTLTFLCLFAGCSSWHHQLSPLDLSGVKKVAIICEKLPVDDIDHRSFNRKLTATGKFTIASEKELQDWQRWSIEQGSKMSKYKSEKELFDSQKALFDSQAQARQITAANLTREYSANELRADSEFTGNLLRVTGVITGIEKDSQNRYFVRLVGTGSDPVAVFFQSSETSKVIALNKGNSITIIGRCTGRTLPYTDNTGEILRLLGTGKAVNIADAEFPVKAPTALAGAPQLGYTGTIDAVIYFSGYNREGGGTKTSCRYRIVRARDFSDLGRGEAGGMTRLNQEGYDEMLDIIVKNIVDAIQ